jgi:phenylalanyl-tRNA synthetase beta chain
MNVSLNWLTDYVDVPVSAEVLAAECTRIGLTLEELIETETDIVLDLEVTSNRPDWLGHVGVARELAAATGSEFRPPRVPDLPGERDVRELTSVTVEATDLCPRYTARILRGVTVGPSPAWMVERLEAVGMRSVNNIVDVTNYVLMEYSQPLHSFDHAKLEEGRIVVRRARDGETMVSIDETTCKLDPSMLVIADACRPVAIAGIMGGLDSEVTDATTDVLLEAAQFDPLTTRQTSRKLALMGQSNYRFERGIDPVALDEASLRACQLILQLAGGRLVDGVADVWQEPYRPPSVSLRPERCRALLGLDVPDDRQREVLDRLGLSPREQDGRIVCTVPAHRADVRREADLIEEVARLVGYEEIPMDPKVTHTVAPEGKAHRLRKAAASVLSAAGYDEALTFTFLDRDEAALVGVEAPVEVDANVRKTNNTLRPTVLPSLLRACKVNQDASVGEVTLYELSAVFPPGRGELPDEFVELAMVTTCDSLRDVRGVLESLVERIAPEASMGIEPGKVAGLRDADSAWVTLDGRTIGSLGVIDAGVQDRYGLERPAATARISFDALCESATLTRRYRPIPRFPSVRRDLSLVVDETTSWSGIAEAIAAVAQPLRVGCEYVTTYRGKPIDADKKSVTVTLEYRSPESTLRSEEVDGQVAEVVSALAERLGAHLRA